MLFALAFFFILTYSQAFPVPGKELVYNYNARVRVGSYEPVSYASQFTLEGKLHLQYGNNDSILVRFTDLNYKLYNGELNHEKEYLSNALPVPQETVDLLRVFRIEYDEDGKLRHITTESGERTYSRHIKKAVASLLQLDRKHLQFDSQDPYAFITEERSIYGRGLEEYNVIPQGEEIVVQKMRDVKTSRHWYSYLGLNLEARFNNVPLASPVSINSHRQYILGRTDEGFRIKQLEAHGGVYLHLLRGQTQAQYMSVNQTLDFLEEIPIDTKYVINNEDRTDQIEFRFNPDAEPESVVDLSFGRHHHKTEKTIELIQHALDDVIIYLDSNQLTLDSQDFRRSQAVNHLHRLITYLDIPTLEHIYAVLSEKSGERDLRVFKVFQQTLPLVGTRASVIFIRNLIRKNKINDDLKIDMLNKLPFYLRIRSVKLLEEVEDLINLEDFKLPVRRAGVLCFASLVHKIFGHLSRHHDHARPHILHNYPGTWNTHFHFHEHSHTHTEHEHHQHEESSEEQILERYIIKFINLLESAPDFQTKFLYIQALYNIQVGNVSKYLEPYVNGTASNSNHHLRFLAMCAALFGDIQDPERVYRIYWPIFTNRNLELELRAGAYYVIMSTKPSMSKFWNIYWFLQTEQSPELYNFVYTHLQSLASLKNYILDEYRISAAQILRYIRKPVGNYFSRAYIFDYTDPKYDFGAMVQSMLISSRTSKILYVDLSNHILNTPFELYSLYFKIDGLDPVVTERLSQGPSRFNFKDLDQIVQILSTLHENKNIHIEYCVFHQNQVVRIEYYDQSNIKELVENIQNFQIENLRLFQNSLDIQYNTLAQMVLPNDLGFPTILQIKSPRITNNYVNITREIVNKITNYHADIRLHTSIPTSIELAFYNPVADLWQGVQRIHLYDHVIPLNLNLGVNTQQESVKLSINRIQDQQNGAFGVRNQVTSIVFVLADIHNNLKESNPQCKSVVEIVRRREIKNFVSLFDYDDENTGLHYEYEVFDTERHVSPKSIVDKIRSIFVNHKNDHGLRLVNFWFSIRNLWSRILLSPGYGSSGFLIRATPSIKYPVSHIDLALRCNHETIKKENVHIPNYRINTRATYSVKNIAKKLIKTWDVNAIFDLNSGLNTNNFKVQISRIVPDEKDFRVCVEGFKKWEGREVNEYVNISFGQSVDNKCVKDDALIEINLKGSIDDSHIPHECETLHLYQPHLKDFQIRNYQSTDCIKKQTDISNYIYNIKTAKLPENLTTKFRNFFYFVSRYYLPYYINQQQNNQIEGNNIRIYADYSTHDNEVNLQIITSQETYNVSRLKLNEFETDNIYYSKKFLWLHKFGLIRSCIIGQERFLNVHNQVVNKNVGDSWVDYVKDADEKIGFTVGVKKIGEVTNKIGLRVVSQDKILEIIPYEGQYQVSLNGNQLQVDKNNFLQESWFTIGVLNNDQQTLILHIINYDLYIDFNGDYVKFNVPQLTYNLIGNCFGL